MLRELSSFPTRRSSDLGGIPGERGGFAFVDGSRIGLQRHGRTSGRRSLLLGWGRRCHFLGAAEAEHGCSDCEDRKSTRLNSSHQISSYAVFCLKKKSKT